MSSEPRFRVAIWYALGLCLSEVPITDVGPFCSGAGIGGLTAACELPVSIQDHHLIRGCGCSGSFEVAGY